MRHRSNIRINDDRIRRQPGTPAKHEFVMKKIYAGGRNLMAHRSKSKARTQSAIELTSQLVTAYVSKQFISQVDLINLIKFIHSELLELRTKTRSSPPLRLSTSSEVAASIQLDRLISFIDGKAYKSLKRHLTAYGLTPDEYRRRYGLPKDYPMVAPRYAELRSRIAKQIYHGPKVS